MVRAHLDCVCVCVCVFSGCSRQAVSVKNWQQKQKFIKINIFPWMHAGLFSIINILLKVFIHILLNFTLVSCQGNISHFYLV